MHELTVDLCMEADIVCDTSNWLLSGILPQAGIQVHITYSEALIQAAAGAVLERALLPMPRFSNRPS